MSDDRAKIEAYLERGPYAVVGASTDRSKYGNRVLRAYLDHDLPVYPINPKADEVEGERSYASLRELPETPRGISIITPPAVTEQVVREAIALGVEFLWMQPGAESPEGIRAAEAAGRTVIANGPCFLVAMATRDAERG